MNKEEERLQRQREIAAFAAEMMSTAPKVKAHPEVPGMFNSGETERVSHDRIDQPSGAKGDSDDSDSDEGFVDDGNDEPLDSEDDESADVDAESGTNQATTSNSSHHNGNKGLGYQDAGANGETNAQETSDPVDAFAVERKVPITHQIELSGHRKAVTAVSIEPAGNRVVTGSLDYGVQLYDFGGMDSRCKAFRTVEAHDGYPVISISHSPSGDRFIAGTGSSQPRIFDREGKELMKFVKGDMYIRDLSNTKGHTMEVTGVQWHPSNKDIVLTSSLDGSLRIWDLTGTLTFGNLVNKHVLKLRAATGQNRLGATCCCYSPDGTKMIGGAADGSLHIWVERKTYTRADAVIRPAHAPDRVITCVVVSPNGQLLATRGEDSTVKLWDLQSLLSSASFSAASTSSSSSSSHRAPTPLKTYEDLPNSYPTANVAFSPDGTLLCCGTIESHFKTETKGKLCFLDTQSRPTSSSGGGGAMNQDKPVMQITVTKSGVGAIVVKWQAATNQIFCSTSSGSVSVLYDPRISKKGAILAAARAPRREKDPGDFVIMGEIYNPHALPMYREEPLAKKRIREKKDPQIMKIPEKQLDKGPLARPNMSFFFTKYVADGKKFDTTRTEDPREALLKVDALAKADPIYFGNAYAATQPQNVLYTQTFEEEQEEFRKRQKKL